VTRATTCHKCRDEKATQLTTGRRKSLTGQPIGPLFVACPGEEPMFTDFTASNIGTPPNPLLPYYSENRPDPLGYVANPDGAAFVDGGSAAFSSSVICSASRWGWMGDGSHSRRTTRAAFGGPNYNYFDRGSAL
jgi:hypothetical protein